MEAKIQINGKPIQINDEALAALNRVLAECPVCQEKYEEGQYVYPPQKNKRMQIKAVFALENEVKTLE